MKLSGWARLWIVASVIWWGAGVVYLAPQMPSLSTPIPEPIPAGCEDRKPPESLPETKSGPEISTRLQYTECDWKMFARGRRREDWLAYWTNFGIAAAMWFVAPLALWLGFRIVAVVGLWVIRGFWPKKSQPPAP